MESRRQTKTDEAKQKKKGKQIFGNGQCFYLEVPVFSCSMNQASFTVLLYAWRGGHADNASKFGFLCLQVLTCERELIWQKTPRTLMIVQTRVDRKDSRFWKCVLEVGKTKFAIRVPHKTVC